MCYCNRREKPQYNSATVSACQQHFAVRCMDTGPTQDKIAIRHGNTTLEVQISQA